MQTYYSTHGVAVRAAPSLSRPFCVATTAAAIALVLVPQLVLCIHLAPPRLRLPRGNDQEQTNSGGGVGTGLIMTAIKRRPSTEKPDMFLRETFFDDSRTLLRLRRERLDESHVRNDG